MATQKQVFTEITESIDRCNHTLPGLIQFLKNGFQKLENASGGGGGGSEVSWTQIQATGTKIAEIEIDGDKTNVYAPTGATPTISVKAEDVAYSNTVSGLTADNCQEAIDELKSLIPSGAGSVEITSDGTKTWTVFLSELLALVDLSKVSYKSYILDSAHFLYTMNFCNKTTGSVNLIYVNEYMTTQDVLIHDMIRIGTVNVKYSASGATVTNNSQNLVPNGLTLTLYY